MGLFKKKSPTHNEKVDIAYQCFKPEIIDTLFPSGKKQAENIIISLALILELDLNKCDAKKYFSILSVYSDVFIRKVISQSTEDAIIISLQTRHEDLINNKYSALRTLIYTEICMKNNSFVLHNNQDLIKLDFMVKAYIERKETSNNNAKAEKENLDDPEYGLVIEKPIYTLGVTGSNIYLKQLRTPAGEELLWKRRGSTFASETNGCIDIYDSTLPSGEKYKTLYLNMYGSSNSTIIPQGFITNISSERSNNDKTVLKQTNATVTKKIQMNTSSDVYNYIQLDDGSLEITKYKGKETEVSIPSEIDGCPISIIGETAFSNNNVLTTLLIPRNVLHIRASAFSGCKKLSSVSLPDSLISIATLAFSNCEELRLIDIPNSLKSIGDFAFSGCKNLTYIKLPDSLTIIGDNPFSRCRSLESIYVSQNHPYLATINGVLFYKPKKRLVCYPCALNGSNYSIPKGIIEIGAQAFCDCSSLLDITIPNTVFYIGDEAFSGCVFKTISLPDSVTEIGANPFSDCPLLMLINISSNHPFLSFTKKALINKQEKRLISVLSYCASDSFIVPDEVDVIGNRALANHFLLKKIEISSNVKTIDKEAFYYCQSLENIKIPGNVKSIADRAFFGCEKLETILLSEGVSSIGMETFGQCFSLKELFLPKSLLSIGKDAFHLCTSLTKIIIQKGTKKIGDSAFANCNSLVSIEIPDSIESIGKQAFWWCKNITSIDIPSSVEKIGESAFSGCSHIASINIPKGIRSISPSVFWGCDSLTSVTIPKNVESIGATSFILCRKLNTVVIEEGVSSIGDKAFSACEALSTVTIPSSMTSIGHCAFFGCTSLKQLKIPNTVTNIGVNAFYNCPNLQLLVEKDSFAEKYAIKNNLSYNNGDSNIDWLFS